MANATAGRGLCPAPFLQLSEFPYQGGFQSGRLCLPTPARGSPGNSIECCLPCPVTDWVYEDDFHKLINAANWINVASIICCMLLLITFAVLPVARTHRHYLTIGVLTGVGFMSLAFMVPLGSKPNQCRDAITPNDMFSDLSCAFSGSFLVFGGIAAVTWVFLRSLSLHLQICWQVLPGRKFFIASLVVGWGIPALLLALVLSLTGVSYRFGSTCHINHEKSVQTLWGPILAFAGAAAVLQFTTFGYCIRVYIRTLLNPEDGTQTSTHLPSYHGSTRTVNAGAAYRRVRKVISLQWRGIIIVLIIITDVVFFSIIFLKIDRTTVAEATDQEKTMPWLLCLVLNKGNKNKCLADAASLVINEATVMAVLFLLSFNGIWALIFVGKFSMVKGWSEFLRLHFSRSHDFVSVDARRLSDPRNYEMLTSMPNQAHIQKGLDEEDTLTDAHSSKEFSPSTYSEGYYGRDARYRSPSFSFSSPRPPSRQTSTATRNASSQGKDLNGSPHVRTSVDAIPETSRTESSSEHDRTDPVLERSNPNVRSDSNRSKSALGREREDHAPGLDRIGSTSPGSRSESLGHRDPARPVVSRGLDPRNAHTRSDASPASGRSNSALGRREWDPRMTYARGTGAPSPDRAGTALGVRFSPELVQGRGAGGAAGSPR